MERLGPDAVREVKGTKDVCANVDLFSGLIYRMLDVYKRQGPVWRCAPLPHACADNIRRS